MLEEIKNLTLEAGTHLLKAGRTNYQIFNKEGRGEYVTQWDIKIQNMLEEGLKKICPEAGFLGEEGGTAGPELESGWCFIVDPIDGTNNFIRSYCHSAISVALSHKGEVLYGAVCDPYLGELFYAEKGKGAFCNGKEIRAGDRKLKESVVIFGTSNYDRSFTNPTFTLLRALFDQADDLRNGGSAVLDLCYIACGRGDIFFEYQLCPWDYAAGGLILSEAGGVMETMEGKAPPLCGKSPIIAATPRLLEEIRSMGII